MPADLSEFEAFSRIAPSRCKVGRTLDGLTAGDAEKLEAALAAPHISHGSIVSWLRARGLPVSDQVVRTHRLGKCCCV